MSARRAVVDKPAAPPVQRALHASGSAIVSSADLMRKQHETYMVVGHWAPLLHEPAINFAMMVWGLPGQGKSTLLIKLARYLARTFGPALYVSNEEFGSRSLQSKLSNAGGSVPGLDFTKHIPDDATLARYKFLILDSVATLKITLEQFMSLTERHPHLARIVVMQSTKAGQFRGENLWPHQVDIEVEAFGPGKARVTKNRFGPLRTITIF